MVSSGRRCRGPVERLKSNDKFSTPAPARRRLHSATSLRSHELPCRYTTRGDAVLVCPRWVAPARAALTTPRSQQAGQLAQGRVEQIDPRWIHQHMKLRAGRLILADNSSTRRFAFPQCCPQPTDVLGNQVGKPQWSVRTSLTEVIPTWCARSASCPPCSKLASYRRNSPLWDLTSTRKAGEPHRAVPWQRPVALRQPTATWPKPHDRTAASTRLPAPRETVHTPARRDRHAGLQELCDLLPPPIVSDRR